MAQRCLIHTATRRVLHVTTDDAMAAPADHEYVTIAAPLDLSGGPWALTVAKALRARTAQEIIDYAVYSIARREAAAIVEFRDLLASCIAAEADVTNTVTAKAVFRDLRLWLRTRLKNGA